MICVNKVKVTYRFITNNAKGSRFAWKLACRSFEVAPRRLVSHWSIHCATQQAWLSNIRRCIAPYYLNKIPPAWLCRKIYYAFRQQIPPTSMCSCHKRFCHSLVFFLSARLGKGVNNEYSAPDPRRFHNRWDFKSHVTAFFPMWL